MPTLDSNFIISPPLQEVFRDKDTALPLRNGYVEFYRDTDRITPKDVFKLDGAPGNYNYISLGAVVTLTQNGTWGDGLGNDIALAYFPFIEVDGVQELDRYFIRVFSVENVEQFTRQAWPRIGDEETTDTTFNNYISDGQFWNYRDLPNGGQLTGSDFVTYGGGQTTINGGESTNGFSTWIAFLSPGSTSNDTVTFERFNSFITNPESNPRYSLRWNTVVPDLSDTAKHLVYRINNVNFIASDTEFLTFQFEAKSNLTGPILVGFDVQKSYGTGGSPQEFFNVTSFSIEPGWSKYTVNFVLESNDGNNLGPQDDDMLEIFLSLPTDQVNDLNFTNFILRDGSFSTLSYPEQTPRQNQSQTLIMPIPNHDLTDEGKALILGSSGMFYGNLSSLTLGSISGYVVENDVSDLNRNVKFNTGFASSASGDVISLTAPLVKLLNAAWVVGDNQGGLFSGAIAPDTTYHLFAIKDPLANSVDCGFDIDVNAANRPAAYTEFHRIASLYTDGSSDLVQFLQSPLFPDEFHLKTPVSTFTLGSSSSAILEKLSIPIGVNLMGLGYMTLTVPGGVITDITVLVTSPLINDTPVTGTLFHLCVKRSAAGEPDTCGSIHFDILTDTLANIRYRSRIAIVGAEFFITTDGWRDKRGQT